MKTSVYKHSFVVVFVLIFTLSMSITTMMAQSSTLELIKLKVLLLPFLSFAPFFIAQEEGYFTEQGLEIEFIKMDSTATAIPALLHGELDVMAGDIRISTLNALSRGGELKIVADKGHITPDGCPSNALLARRALVEGGELDSPAQLKGRRIATTYTTMYGYFVDKVLKTAGLTIDDVILEDLPYTTRPQALESGAVDIINVSEPWITRMLDTGNAVVWVPISDVMIDFQLAVIVYGPSLLKENSEAGRRFMVAYLKAIRQYNQGKTARNVEILAKHTKLQPELLQKMCWPLMHNDGHINVTSVLDFQQWGMEKGLLDSLISEDQFWDGSFIEYANQVLGTSTK